MGERAEGVKIETHPPAPSLKREGVTLSDSSYKKFTGVTSAVIKII